MGKYAQSIAINPVLEQPLLIAPLRRMATMLRLLCAVAAATAFSPKIVGRISSGGHFLTLERAPFSETMTVEERDAGWECVIPEATSLCDTEKRATSTRRRCTSSRARSRRGCTSRRKAAAWRAPDGHAILPCDPKADTVSMTVSDATARSTRSRGRGNRSSWSCGTRSCVLRARSAFFVVV